MNWLIRFPGRIFSAIRSFFVNLSSPFQMLGSAWRTVSIQFQYILDMPRRYLNLPKGGAGNLLRDMRDSLSYRNDPAVAKRVKVAESAQYSQIHLIDAANASPIVVHIGTTIGRSSSEVTVGTVGSTRLSFGQIDSASGGLIGMTVIYSREPVLLNDKPVSGELPLQNGSVIRVGKQVYTVKLFAWDRTPVVVRVNAGWATSTGAVRDSNEDAIGLYQHQRGYLFALADGVGGAQYGEQMSAFAVHYLLAVFNRNIPYNLDWEAVLGRAYQNINAEIRNFVKRSTFSAGTTLTSVVIKDWEASIAHVGDSRLYHWRNDTLTQITRDHARREEVINNTRHANETRTPPPMRDILEKAMGKTDHIQPDLINLRLLPGDKILLCSDGITGVVPIEEIAQLVANQRPNVVAESLVRIANEKGSKDNASAVAIEVMREAYVQDIWRARESERVYAGYRSRPLHLSKPEDKFQTRYPQQSSNRRRLIAFIIVAALVLWGISAFNARQQASAMMNSPQPTENASLPIPAIIPSPTAQALTSPTPFATLIVPITPELPANGTPPAMSSASRTDLDTEHS